MGKRSKDLLKFEEQEGASFSESGLLVCSNKDPSSEKKNCKHDKNVTDKILTTPIPASQVLGRVKDFLGVMAKANKRLELDAKEKSQEDYDIEVLTGDEREYIEMDLVLGIADLHTPDAVAAAEAAIAGSQSIFPSSVFGDGSDPEDSDEDDSTICSQKKCLENPDKEDSNSKPLKKRPKISELN